MKNKYKFCLYLWIIVILLIFQYFLVFFFTAGCCKNLSLTELIKKIMENKEFFENNSALTHKMIKMLAPNVEGLYIYSLVHGDWLSARKHFFEMLNVQCPSGKINKTIFIFYYEHLIKYFYWFLNNPAFQNDLKMLNKKCLRIIIVFDFWTNVGFAELGEQELREQLSYSCNKKLDFLLKVRSSQIYRKK